MYGTPLFGSLMTKVYKLYNAVYYLFINGDILLSPFLNIELSKLKIHLYYKRIYGTSDRHNVYIDAVKKIEDRNRHNIYYKKGRQYTLCGQDAFLTNRNTFNKKQIEILNEIGVGRIKIDNIILGMAVKDKNIITFDLSNIFKAIHLQYHSNYNIIKRDYNWNRDILAKLNSKLITLACMNRIKWKVNITTYKLYTLS